MSCQGGALGDWRWGRRPEARGGKPTRKVSAHPYGREGFQKDTEGIETILVRTTLT